MQKEIKNKNMSLELLVCECSSLEHQIIIYKEDDQVYAYFHLSNLSFFRRIKYAIKYIFGYKCKYGAFEEFMFGEQHVESLKNIIKELENK